MNHQDTKTSTHIKNIKNMLKILPAIVIHPMKGIKKPHPTSLKGLQRSRQQLPGGRFRQRRQRHGARRQGTAAVEAAEEHRQGALQVLGKCWEKMIGFSFFSCFCPSASRVQSQTEGKSIGLRLYLEERTIILNGTSKRTMVPGKPIQ